MIPYGRQDIDAADVAAVVDVLHSDFITQGPAIIEFESALKAYCRVPHAFAMNSATSALHVAYMALNLGRGDIVWTSPVTFVATANAALYCGAEVVFVDIDPDTYVMSLDRLEEMLIAANRDNCLPKIVVPVHLAGQSCDMVRMASLAQTYGFKVVEDASHSIGSHFDGVPVGACQYSDICVFSFHPVKIITTGEGGAAMTRNDALATRISLLRSHGVTRDPHLMQNTPDGAWYYEQIALGYNYRMTDIQAALGTSQMTRLDSFIAARHRVKDLYHESLSDLPLKLPYQADNQRSALHLYPVLTTTDSPLDRAALFTALREADIGVNVHYMPVYRQPYYSALGYAQDSCPNADHYYANAVSIPMYAALTQVDQNSVIANLHRLLS